jgi:hypothetical protein
MKEEGATVHRGTVAYGAETPDMSFVTDKEDSTGAETFFDPAAPPTRDGAQ